MQVLQSNITAELNPINQESHINSKRYQHLDSREIINALETSGFYHKETSFATPRNEEKRGFQKHIMIFEHDDLIIDAENRLQLLVTNSHDGKSSIRFNVGIFRTVCANGLVVGTNFFEERIRHVGHNFYLNIEEVLTKVKERAPIILEEIQKMQATYLSNTEMVVLASRVANQRLDAKSLVSVDLEKMLTPLRDADKKKDLYTVYNLLQEKVIKGGIEYIKEKFDKNEDTGLITRTLKRNTTREISSIDKKIELNQMVFDTVSFFNKVA